MAVSTLDLRMNNGESLILALQVIKTQLKEKHFQTLEDAMMEAKDREVASSHPGPKLFSG